MYGANPFPESVEISRYIRSHSRDNDRIAILGSEPQIYFYSRRPSATGYIYTYALMEHQKYAKVMQRQMIEEIERARPEFLIFVNVTTSWLVQPDSDISIFRWFEAYRRGFDLAGVIDILPGNRTEYRWRNEAASYSPRSNQFIYVFKRMAGFEEQPPRGFEERPSRP